MTQLEDFRSRLDDSDPSALERARTRLRAAQAASTGRRRTGPRPRIRLAAAVGVAVAAAVAAILVGVGSGTNKRGLVPAPADARAVLVHAADAAASARDGGLTRLPRPDEFYYLEIRGTYRDGETRGARTTTRLNTRTYRRWESITRTGRIDTGSRPPAAGVAGALPPTGRYFIGNERFSHDELAAFDPTPHELYRRLLRDISPGQGSSPEAEVFVELVDALRDVPLPPRLRATFLRALADVPGLQFTGPTRDSLGRPGLGVAYVERSRQDERHVLILGTDGALLAVRDTTANGTLLEDAVIVRQAIVRRLPPVQRRGRAGRA
jgi:hypothetical protein